MVGMVGEGMRCGDNVISTVSDLHLSVPGSGSRSSASGRAMGLGNDVDKTAEDNDEEQADIWSLTAAEIVWDAVRKVVELGSQHSEEDMNMSDVERSMDTTLPRLMPRQKERI